MTTRPRGLLAEPVLCGVDFSAHSRPALRYAALAAAKLHRRLTVLHVDDPLLAAAAAYAYDRPTVEEQTLRELQRFGERALGKMLPDDIEYVITTGQPAAELAAAAARLGATLVAIGMHGSRRAGPALSGSTAMQLLKTCSAPVLAVPPGLRRTPPADWPGPQIAVAVGAGDDREAEVDAAAEFAGQLGAGLIVLHVPTEPNKMRWSMLRHRDNEEAPIEHAAEPRARVDDDLPRRVDTEVLSGHSVDAMARVVKRRRIGLLILTRRVAASMGHAHRAFLDDVLATTVLPVLVAAHSCGRREAQRR